MHRIAIQRIQLQLLAIEQGGLGGNRTRRHHVTVGQHQSLLGINNKAGGLRRAVPLGIEGTGRIDLDGHHALRDALEGCRPRRVLARRCLGLRQRRRRPEQRHTQ